MDHGWVALLECEIGISEFLEGRRDPPRPSLLREGEEREMEEVIKKKVWKQVKY